MRKTLTTLGCAGLLALGLQLGLADPSDARRGGACKTCDWVAHVQFCRAENSVDGFRHCEARADNECDVSGWCRISEPL